MKKTWTSVCAVLLVAAIPLAARADISKQLTDVDRKTAGALAMITYKLDAGQGQERMGQGLGVCVNAQGLFMTMAISSTAKVEYLKDFEVVLPGVGGKKIKATLLGVDPSTGIGFVQAEKGYTFSAVVFAPTADLQVGQQVVSIGLLGGSAGNTRYFGAGYLSAVFRVPGRLAYVTGGRLTGMGSPVFSGGKAIGIVSGQQLMFGSRMSTGRQTVNVQISGQQETAFFLPVDEFLHVLQDEDLLKGKPRRLPWTGAIVFAPVGKDLAAILKLDKPGVKVDRIVPGQPADKAGLKNNDVIVAMNGKPLEKMATSDLVAASFRRTLFRMKPGQQLSLTVLRGGKTERISFILGTMPKQAYEAEQYIQRVLGFVVREKVTMDEYANQGPTAKIPGLVVVAVGQRTSAAAAGLKRGDLITNVKDQPVKTVKAFKQIVDSAVANKPNEAINMLIRRGEQSMAVSLRVPKR